MGLCRQREDGFGPVARGPFGRVAVAYAGSYHGLAYAPYKSAGGSAKSGSDDAGLLVWKAPNVSCSPN